MASARARWGLNRPRAGQRRAGGWRPRSRILSALSRPSLSCSAHGGRQGGAALPERLQPAAAGAPGGAAVAPLNKGRSRCRCPCPCRCRGGPRRDAPPLPQPGEAMAAGEAVTLQLGPYAGCVGSHWWGLQVGGGRRPGGSGGGPGAHSLAHPRRPRRPPAPPSSLPGPCCGPRAGARRAARRASSRWS